MRHERDRSFRVLAIDPSVRGFGYAIIERPDRLLDWGVKHVPAAEKNAACLRRIEEFIAWYGPDTLVVEDSTHRSCRRRARARALVAEIVALATRRKLRCVAVPWHAVRLACGGDRKATKERIAAVLAGRLLELAPRLPPHRKLWMSEDDRMSIFDAAALALAFLQAASEPTGYPPGSHRQV